LARVQYMSLNYSVHNTHYTDSDFRFTFFHICHTDERNTSSHSWPVHPDVEAEASKSE